MDNQITELTDKVIKQYAMDYLDSIDIVYGNKEDAISQIFNDINLSNESDEERDERIFRDTKDPSGQTH